MERSTSITDFKTLFEGLNFNFSDGEDEVNGADFPDFEYFDEKSRNSPDPAACDFGFLDIPEKRESSSECFEGKQGDRKEGKRTKHPRRFQCMECFDTEGIVKCYTRTQQLNDHIMVVHRKIRPHKCGVCHATFTNKSALTKHRNHTCKGKHKGSKSKKGRG